ncbi:hypothetical protein JCM18750_37020 [Halostagnicola bangensis]
MNVNKLDSYSTRRFVNALYYSNEVNIDVTATLEAVGGSDHIDSTEDRDRHPQSRS